MAKPTGVVHLDRGGTSVVVDLRDGRLRTLLPWARHCPA